MAMNIVPRIARQGRIGTAAKPWEAVVAEKLSDGTSEMEVDKILTDLAGAAPRASPALTGVPTAPTAAAGTATTQLATTAFVKTAIAETPPALHAATHRWNGADPILVGTGNITLYVAPTGNDGNPGTAALPFLTPSAALNYAAQLSTTGNITISIAPGSYAGFTIPAASRYRCDQLVIGGTGEEAMPSINGTISTAASSGGPRISLSNLAIRPSSATADCVFVGDFSSIRLVDTIRFGGTYRYGVNAGAGGAKFRSVAAIVLESLPAGSLLYTTYDGSIVTTGSVNCGGLAGEVGAFLRAEGASKISFSTSFSGHESVTGPRAIVSGCADLFTGNRLATLPGSTAAQVAPTARAY